MIEIDLETSKISISTAALALSQISSSYYQIKEYVDYYIILVQNRNGEVLEAGLVGKYYELYDIEDEIRIKMAEDLLKNRRK